MTPPRWHHRRKVVNIARRWYTVLFDGDPAVQNASRSFSVSSDGQSRPDAAKSLVSALE
jgi:hypothetical protein